MSLISILVYLALAHRTVSSLQINLHLTHWTDENNQNITQQHDCLYVTIPIQNQKDTRQILFYCLDEQPSKWNIQRNQADQIYTFSMLRQRSITSQELYTWSAPIDIVERYEYYLNQVAFSKNPFMTTELFYNCTQLRFGPMCQFSLDDNEFYSSTLQDVVHNIYLHRSEPATLTCYTHLQCDRGIKSVCLDWTEVCDGKIDCMDSGLDEENCWQLEINECKNNEYRCTNGQCISDRFFHDDPIIPDCLDRSDEIFQSNEAYRKCRAAQPTFACEDITCTLQWRSANKPFSSSCLRLRLDLFLHAIESNKPESINQTCWTTYKCTLHMIELFAPECEHCLHGQSCSKIIRESCPYLTLIPSGPVFFGNIYFGYINNESRFSVNQAQQPQYICSTEKICNHLFFNDTMLFYRNLTCRRLNRKQFNFKPGRGSSWLSDVLIPIFNRFWSCISSSIRNLTLCNKLPCVLQHYLDGLIYDYSHGNNDTSVVMLDETCDMKTQYQCKSVKRCIPTGFVQDGICDCTSYESNLCEDEYPDVFKAQTHISFQTICDGFTELLPINIHDVQETDETNCLQYPCNNTYTRCNGIWNCFNGADEVDCDSSPLINCSRHHHVCVSPLTNDLKCLPISQANDGKIDCLGATDEPTILRSMPPYDIGNKFHCENANRHVFIPLNDLCDRQVHCNDKDDERFCRQNITGSLATDPIRARNIKYNNAEKFFRKHLNNTHKRYIVHFSHGPIQKQEHDEVIVGDPSSIKTQTLLKQTQRCHRGLHVKVWLNSEKNLTTDACFCPPNYYGEQCQYQNQRVSLTVSFETYSDSWRTPFVLVISLIDNSLARIIHSSEQILYLPMEDCEIKFNLYLIYAERPKRTDPSYYAIHIDIFEKISLTYRGSWLIPLKFSFLPVYRIATQLMIPPRTTYLETCFYEQCVNGRCAKYSNNPNGTAFCQCYQGWSGRYCTIPQNCTCSSGSLCIGHMANKRPLCVCPIGKFGPQCFIENAACKNRQYDTCKNGGQCIPVEEYRVFNKKFICICPKGFTGDRCEKADSKIILSFHKDIALPQSILAYFIEVMENGPPDIAITWKTIPAYERKITLYWPRTFHLVFLEFQSKNYYLAVVQTVYNQSMTVVKTIDQSKQCKSITQMFNNSINQLHLIQRIKLYHIPCQNQSANLSCFYDETHICLCDYFGEQRLANCFEFNHEMKLDCFGQSGCENGAQCFQDNRICAQTSMCVCPRCFYGARCQFSTHGFRLSLDAILGYHIQPHVSIRNQPLAVRLSVVLSIVMSLAGFVDGILSLMAFCNKSVLKNGCGLYLLGSSITTLLTFIIFIFKFWTLMLAQMTLITNHSFLKTQCVLLDFFLRILLTMDHWLNACVAADRAVVVNKGTRFDQRKSKTMAKGIFIFLFIFIVGTTVHDPIHRNLIDDENEDERRIWCISKYSSGLRTYDSIVYIFHFSVPFLVNLTSAIFIIFSTARQRATVQRNLTYRQNLYRQIREHYNLPMAPILLVIIATPRLIISSVSGCMNSTRDSWLFLIGYFVSFIPTMLTFITFVVPSITYRREFKNCAARFRKWIQSCKVYRMK